MRKQIEVKIPTKGKDLRIKHFKSMGLVPIDPILNGDEGLHFLAAFTGLRHNQLLDFRTEDIKTMIGTALGAIGKMDLTSKLPETISLAGTSYQLVNPDKVGIGWHIDFKNCNIDKDPVRLACMFYLQEGFNYSDVDENDNIKFPISSRMEVFAEHFPLDLFMRCCGFFLRRSLGSMKRSMANNLSVKENLRLLRRSLSNGKQLLKQ